MSRSTLGRLVPVACALGLALAGPVGAQESPPTDPSTTSSTSSTTLAGPTVPQVPPASDSTIPGDSTTTTLAEDPAAHGDAPPDTVPDVSVTIPPRAPVSGFYADQGSYASHPGRLVRVTARAARVRAAETQAALDAATAIRDTLLTRRSELLREIGRLQSAETAAIVALRDAQLALEERAADAYVRGSVHDIGNFLSAADAGEFFHRRELLSAVAEADAEAVQRFAEARSRVDADQAATAAELTEVTRGIEAAFAAVLAAQAEAEFAARELAVSLAGGTVVIHGFVFPVAAPVNYGDSFGAPRMPGTEYEHWHEGTDIFAAAGSELVACERGVITRLGNNVLGGITVWLLGESGTAYYYAHLLDYAPGIREGMVVEAATVLGYVGNTGNAVGTPPHLHFEVHPNRGDAVNPYPILAVSEGQPQPEPIRLGSR